MHRRTFELFQGMSDAIKSLNQQEKELDAKAAEHAKHLDAQKPEDRGD